MNKKKTHNNKPIMISSATSSANRIDFSAFKEYDVDDVITYLKNNIEGSLSENTCNILRNNEVDGAALLLLSKTNLLDHPYNLAGDPASKIAAEIKRINNCLDDYLSKFTSS